MRRKNRSSIILLAGVVGICCLGGCGDSKQDTSKEELSSEGLAEIFDDEEIKDPVPEDLVNTKWKITSCRMKNWETKTPEEMSLSDMEMTYTEDSCTISGNGKSVTFNIDIEEEITKGYTFALVLYENGRNEHYFSCCPKLDDSDEFRLTEDGTSGFEEWWAAYDYFFEKIVE